jgi:hypothetical protein
MSYYRLYLLDESGSIRHCIDFDATDDGHAIDKATGLQGDYHGMELWHLTRIVKRWSSAPG